MKLLLSIWLCLLSAFYCCAQKEVLKEYGPFNCDRQKDFGRVYQVGTFFRLDFRPCNDSVQYTILDRSIHYNDALFFGADHVDMTITIGPDTILNRSEGKVKGWQHVQRFLSEVEKDYGKAVNITSKGRKRELEYSCKRIAERPSVLKIETTNRRLRWSWKLIGLEEAVEN